MNANTLLNIQKAARIVRKANDAAADSARHVTWLDPDRWSHGAVYLAYVVAEDSNTLYSSLHKGFFDKLEHYIRQSHREKLLDLERLAETINIAVSENSSELDALMTEADLKVRQFVVTARGRPDADVGTNAYDREVKILSDLADQGVAVDSDSWAALGFTTISREVRLAEIFS